MTQLSTHQLAICRGKKILSRDLSFTLAPGDCWAVLGPNGSGKSTLLHTLSGQIAAASGQVFLNEATLAALSTRNIAREIGILFQDTSFAFPQSVTDYCLDARFPHHSLFSAPENNPADLRLQQEIFASLHLTGLAEKNIQLLSGGEQRRVVIAALLMQAPAIFLLDEPVNQLDLRHQIAVMNIFAYLSKRGRAVMMSLHNINLAARFCNKILMLFADGSVVHGLRDAVLSRDNLSRLYQHPIDVMHNGHQTYVIYTDDPQHNEEPAWQYVY